MTPTVASGTPGRHKEDLPDSQVRMRERDQRQHPYVANLSLPGWLYKPCTAVDSWVAESAYLRDSTCVMRLNPTCQGESVALWVEGWKASMVPKKI